MKTTVLTRDEVGVELAEPGWEFHPGDEGRQPLRTLDELREAGFKPEALFVRVYDVWWSSPTESCGYYPVSFERSINASALIGVPLESAGRDGGVLRPALDAMTLSDYRGVREFRVALRDLGRTYPVTWRRRAIAPPKVRAGVETRWREGRWEKLLKSGWKTV